MIRRFVTALAILFLTGLAGCTGLSNAKTVAYGKAAERGNLYCENSNPALKAEAKGAINTQLRANGAKFEFEGITCDDP